MVDLAVLRLRPSKDLKQFSLKGSIWCGNTAFPEPNPRTHRESLGKRERSSELSETAWRHNGCMKLYESARPSQVFTVCTCFWRPKWNSRSVKRLNIRRRRRQNETSLLRILRQLLWTDVDGTNWDESLFLNQFFTIVFQCSDVFRTSNPEAMQVQELNANVLVPLLIFFHTSCDPVECWV